MRLAIIGAGSIGTRHVRTALALGCAVEIWEPDEARRVALMADRQYAGAAVPSSPDTLRWADAWVIASPYQTHLQWAQRAVALRMPVFTEKPLGALDQLDAWRALVAQSDGLTTQVGYMLRFHEKARARLEWIHQQAFDFDSAFTVASNMAEWPGSGYGPMLLEYSHELDLAMFLLGPASVVRAVRWGDRNYDIALRHASGRCSQVRFHDGPAWRGRDWAFSFDRWHWCFDSDTFRTPESLGDQMYRDELEHFIACVQAGRQTDCPLADGLAVLEICQQVEQMVTA